MQVLQSIIDHHLLRVYSKVKWIGSTLGQVFGTIGGDNKFKLWREDQSQAPKSGRRFRCVFSQSPNNHVAYVSFDFKTVKNEVWLVLVTHDGLLSLFEPSEPESLSAWKELDQIYPYGQHSRGTEPRFRLSLHRSERPCYNAVVAGLDPKALSLAVSAMSFIKIYRALKPEEGSYQLHEMIELATDAPLINDVSWAPGCIRPYDLIAAACDDGFVRVFEITTPVDAKTISRATLDAPIPRKPGPGPAAVTARNAPSGIGAGLAGVSRAAARNTADTVKIRHEWKEVAALHRDEGAPVWKVEWMHDGEFTVYIQFSAANTCSGNAFASTGDSGILHIWKQNIDGQFIEFAETGPG